MLPPGLIADDQKTMRSTEAQMQNYYAKRALEYEAIYARPERQADLASMKQYLSEAFAGEQVLELACGTGYWTQFIAQSAISILATDFNPEVIELARQKAFGTCQTEFVISDAYALDDIPDGHSAGFHAFWWSHVPVRRIDEFLAQFHARLGSGAKVIMMDNSYVEGSSTPISGKDPDGNTYQPRKLADGSEHEVLKNFPSDSELYNALSGHARDIQVTHLPHYWIVEYRTL